MKPVNRLKSFRFALCLLALAVLTVSRAVRIEAAQADQPNFIFILVDDLRWDTLSCAGHPFVKTPNIDTIAASGVRFTNAFCTTSLCSPSRASFLTGTYAHVHGVTVNEKRDPDPRCPSFPQVLQTVGYETAFIGKWHMRPNADPRPGFDYWLSFRMQGEYLDPELNENGREFQKKGYMTDILTEYAVNYLKRPRTRPFCLYLSHKAMHADFIPPERHKNLYKPSDLIESASYRDDLSGKPAWLRKLRICGGQFKRPVPEGGIPERLSPGKWNPEDPMNQRRLNWHRTLAAVDESVGQVQRTLRELGVADKTVVIFAGDNGFFLGEHGLPDKRLAYEESMRIPLLMSVPGLGEANRLPGQMVLNIDVAPTILDLAGADIPAIMQGRSLKPILEGKKVASRKSFFYRYCQEDWLPGYPTIEAVRTRDFKYIRTPKLRDIDELYDLTQDPQEMNNLAGDPASQAKRYELKAELERLIHTTQR